MSALRFNCFAYGAAPVCVCCSKSNQRVLGNLDCGTAERVGYGQLYQHMTTHLDGHETNRTGVVGHKMKDRKAYTCIYNMYVCHTN